MISLAIKAKMRAFLSNPILHQTLVYQDKKQDYSMLLDRISNSFMVIFKKEKYNKI